MCSLVVPNSTTSLCFVDRVWEGIKDKRLLSFLGGGGGGGGGGHLFEV